MLIRMMISLIPISMILLENIKKSYFLDEKEIPIIQDVNLTISE